MMSSSMGCFMNTRRVEPPRQALLGRLPSHSHHRDHHLASHLGAQLSPSDLQAGEE